VNVPWFGDCSSRTMTLYLSPPSSDRLTLSNAGSAYTLAVPNSSQGAPLYKFFG